METEMIDKIITEMSNYLAEQQSRIDTVLNRGLSLEDFDSQQQLKYAASVAYGVMQKIKISDAFKNNNRNIVNGLEGLYKLWTDVQEIPFDKALDKIMGMIGFIAADTEMVKDAEIIFSALAGKKKQNEYPLMGLAYVKLMSGLPEEALPLLRDQALVLNPGNELAKAFLAVAYTALKEKEEARALTHEIISNNRDQIAMALATEVESFYDPETVL